MPGRACPTGTGFPVPVSPVDAWGPGGLSACRPKASGGRRDDRCHPSCPFEGRGRVAWIDRRWPGDVLPAVPCRPSSPSARGNLPPKCRLLRRAHRRRPQGGRHTGIQAAGNQRGQRPSPPGGSSPRARGTLGLQTLPSCLAPPIDTVETARFAGRDNRHTPIQVDYSLTPRTPRRAVQSRSSPDTLRRGSLRLAQSEIERSDEMMWPVRHVREPDVAADRSDASPAVGIRLPALEPLPERALSLAPEA